VVLKKTIGKTSSVEPCKGGREEIAIKVSPDVEEKSSVQECGCEKKILRML
jgi:hypothetical protein